MEIGLDQLFSFPNLVFCLVVSVLVLIQRKLIEEVLWKNSVNNKWWNELCLPLAPMGTGALLAGLIAQYPYPEGFDVFWGRVFFGIVCGMASGTVYRIAKKMWKEKEENTKDISL